MVRDVLDLRANSWVPRREEVKAKTITEIHTEAEKNLGLRPGATASIRNSRNIVSGTRKMPGMPGIDNDNWEVPRTRAMPRGDGSGVQTRVQQTHVQSPLMGKSMPLNSRLLPQGSAGFISGRTSALLQGSGPLLPALPTLAWCVEELKSPAYHPEVVKEAISLALEKSPPCVDPVAKLLEFLFSKKVLTTMDIGTGCLMYGSMLDDIGIDLPKAPNSFGEVIGNLVLAGALDFKVVTEIMKKVEDDRQPTLQLARACSSKPYPLFARVDQFL
ncbi:Eukaryotic translation initiation factor isoform 4G-1 [Vitis vinifera]|uniref:Eukaryotic translation initiation factor isoform 4G-1 n=1 Tax=Vitis vinifera TaxID=29760 RepID=A0A438DRT3_VITVI|nr:Eukaryotic translation initiation factor isoform 4G-1 [Vitis vinifera]